MSVSHVLVSSGQTVSSGFQLDRAADFIAVAVPSLAANVWTLDAALTISGPWAPVTRDDGTGVAFVGYSGAAGAFFRAPCLSTFARVRTSGATTVPASVAVWPLTVP